MANLDIHSNKILFTYIRKMVARRKRKSNVNKNYIAFIGRKYNSNLRMIFASADKPLKNM